MPRLLPLSLALLGALALAAAFWVSGSDEPAEGVQPPAVERSPGSQDPPAPEADPIALEPVEDRGLGGPVRSSASPPRRAEPGSTEHTGDTPVSLDLSAAPPGALRIVGRVEFPGEIEVLPPDARVIAALVREEGHTDARFVHAPVSADGRFACVLTEWSQLNPREREERVVEVRFLGSGLTSEADQLSTPEDEAEVLQVDLYTESLVAGLAGRIVDSSGKPVVGLIIGCSMWGQDGGVERSLDTWTAADGTFLLDSDMPGLCTLHAAHMDHGSVVRTVEIGGERIDLGTLMLEPRGVLAGRVTTPEGYGLPHVGVVATRAGDEMEYHTLSDAEGRFRFADLARVPHELWLPELGERGPARRPILPDRTDLALTVRVPVGVFRIVEPKGLRADDISWCFVRLDRQDENFGWAGEEWLASESDALVVALPGPGEYAMSAQSGEHPHLVAYLPFRLEDGTVRHDVRLRPVSGVPVTFEILDPEGRRLDEWKLRYRGVERRVEMGRLSADAPTADLASGTWTIDVYPPRSTPWAPLQTTLAVDGGAARTHTIRLVDRAGYIEFESAVKGKGTMMLWLQDEARARPQFRVSFRAAESGAPSLWRVIEPLAPGPYTYHLNRKNGSTRKGKCVVRPGKVVRIDGDG